MSSIVEKLLIIAFGAVICLNLFSMISPILEKINMDSTFQDDGANAAIFYNFVNNIKTGENLAKDSPGNIITVNSSYSKARIIEFSKVDNFSIITQIYLGSDQVSETIVFHSEVFLYENSQLGENQVNTFLINKKDFENLEVFLKILFIDNIFQIQLD